MPVAAVLVLLCDISLLVLPELAGALLLAIELLVLGELLLAEFIELFD